MEQSNLLQFDSFLGGDITLPDDLSVRKFAMTRIQEIKEFERKIDAPKKKKRAFQVLPINMRRRIMSHSTKRVPRRLREIHQKQLVQSGPPVKKKRPNRKFRRHATNLLLEYERRQRLQIWLETHIWHAKRFHMTSKWGYKLPHYPNDKSFRACYRAVTNHCLLQDISYYVCVEFQGKESELINGLNQMVNPLTGLTFAAKASLSGNRQGKVILFQRNKFPKGAIGTVNFFWKPEENKVDQRTLWIWLHPSHFKEALDEFISIFKLQNEKSILKDSPLTLGKSKQLKRKNIEALKLINKNVPFERTSKYLQKEGNIKMIILKDTLNRFSLIGPMAQAVISKAFKIINLEKQLESVNSKKEEKAKSCPKEDDDWRINIIQSHKGEWINEYYNNEKKKFEVEKQKEFWENIKDSLKIPSFSILGLTIDDPRVSCPRTRSKVYSEYHESKPPVLFLPNQEVSQSAIWNSRVRDIASCSKPSDDTLGRLRSNQLVPGIEYCTVRPYPLPILLLQKPGIRNAENRLGFGGGWDIISPAGWAIPLWLSLVLRGARVGGLRETESIAFESGISLWDPDTQAGQQEATDVEKTLMEKYFRKPPDKRVNYRKLRVACPFKCNWSQLLAEWLRLPEVHEFYVLRDQKKLARLKEVLERRGVKEISNLFPTPAEQLCLVPVNIIMIGKGLPKDRAILALPENCNSLKRKRDKSTTQGPVERTGKDLNQVERKELRKEHARLLRRLRRQRRRGELLDTKEIVSNHASEMRKLWLPDSNILASRKTIGWIVKGGFSLSGARGEGVGFIALPALQELLKFPNPNKVLVRNTTSLQYRFAKLSIR